MNLNNPNIPIIGRPNIPSNLSLLPNVNRPNLVEANYKKERREALIKLDVNKIITVMRKNGQEIPKNKRLFWTIVHETRAALPEIPWEYRQYSRRWLDDHKNSEAVNRGELSEWL